jgi:predicted alpha/beta hydrolase family esterase
MTPTPIPPSLRVLLLPGWLDSGPGHWQTRWQDAHGFERVQQADWTWPRRGDWMVQLEEAVLADPRPALLAAHSLGCHLVAAWAAHSRHADRCGALLVAPPDLDRDDLPPADRHLAPRAATAAALPRHGGPQRRRPVRQRRRFAQLAPTGRRRPGP